MFNKIIRIKPLIKDIGTLGRLSFAFVTGSYRNLSKKAVLGMIIALLYILNPIDAVPDFLSIFGFLDDAAILALITHLLNEDIRKFREWDNSDN